MNSIALFGPLRKFKEHIPSYLTIIIISPFNVWMASEKCLSQLSSNACLEHMSWTCLSAPRQLLYINSCPFERFIKVTIGRKQMLNSFNQSKYTAIMQVSQAVQIKPTLAKRYLRSLMQLQLCWLRWPQLSTYHNVWRQDVDEKTKQREKKK